MLAGKTFASLAFPWEHPATSIDVCPTGGPVETTNE
jgi:hypothetical protein